METMRDIKRRITSVKSTRKITRAMKMVAAAKLRRAQDKAEAARPFFQKTRTILADVVERTGDMEEHPLLFNREGDRHLLIAISGDRGLCGAYNNNVISLVEESIDPEEETNLFLIGKRIKRYFSKRDFNIVSEYVDIGDYPDFEFAYKIGEEIISLFTEDIIDRVSLIYTHFNSAISQSTKKISLLPVGSPETAEEDITVQESEESTEQTADKKVDYIYEPSPGEILDILLPRYVNNVLYASLLESKASEFGSRMTAMDSATDNASEMIDDLTLLYNRARQEEITKEITEIVGGAEALK